MKSFSVHCLNAYRNAGQRSGAFLHGHQKQMAELGLLLVGVTLLSVGLSTGAYADGESGLGTNFVDDRIAKAAHIMLTFIEGAFGALIMVAAGIGAIMSCAFGQYRAALSCLVVAVGSFILRNVLEIFFNTDSIRDAEFLSS